MSTGTNSSAGQLDPYALLGLDRQPPPTAKSIRAAYRRRARQCHPDAGGSSELFERLKAAHDLLLDPARRARFDATGDWQEQTPDNSLAEALALLSIALEKIASAHGHHLSQINMISALSAQLKTDLSETINGRQRIDQTMAIWQSVVERFGSINGKPNHLRVIVEAKLKDLAGHRAAHDARESNVRRAIELLKDAKFNTERSPTPPAMSTVGSFAQHPFKRANIF